MWTIYLDRKQSGGSHVPIKIECGKEVKLKSHWYPFTTNPNPKATYYCPWDSIIKLDHNNIVKPFLIWGQWVNVLECIWRLQIISHLYISKNKFKVFGRSSDNPIWIELIFTGWNYLKLDKTHESLSELGEMWSRVGKIHVKLLQACWIILVT